MTDKEFTHFNLNGLFDLASDPGFRTATVTSNIVYETRNELRKQKINKILKNPLK